VTRSTLTTGGNRAVLKDPRFEGRLRESGGVLQRCSFRIQCPKKIRLLLKFSVWNVSGYQFNLSAFIQFHLLNAVTAHCNSRTDCLLFLQILTSSKLESRSVLGVHKSTIANYRTIFASANGGALAPGRGGVTLLASSARAGIALSRNSSSRCRCSSAACNTQ
jgi:hypothetical protein